MSQISWHVINQKLSAILDKKNPVKNEADENLKGITIS